MKTRTLATTSANQLTSSPEQLRGVVQSHKDQRPEATALHAFSDMANASSRVTNQKTLADTINKSSRMTTQRQTKELVNGSMHPTAAGLQLKARNTTQLPTASATPVMQRVMSAEAQVQIDAGLATAGLAPRIATLALPATTYAAAAARLTAGEITELETLWGVQSPPGADAAQQTAAGVTVATSLVGMLERLVPVVTYGNNFDTKHIVANLTVPNAVAASMARPLLPNGDRLPVNTVFSADGFRTTIHGRNLANGTAARSISGAHFGQNMLIMQWNAHDATYTSIPVGMYSPRMTLAIATNRATRTKTYHASHLDDGFW
jgi:flagella basal body P-ring formation protein FlgA